MLQVVNGLFQPFAAKLLSERVTSRHRASLFSINQLAFSASAIVVAPFIGRVADAYSVPVSARVFLVLFFVLIVSTATLAIRSLRNENALCESS